MTNHQTAQQLADETAIRVLIERWSQAVRDQNRPGIRADHDADLLLFDVPPPFLSRGLEAYMATWDTFYAWSEEPVSFSLHDIHITCGQDVAFATATGQCATSGSDGKREPLEFRLTMGLCKIAEQWRITHEHHSVPATE
jgi:ketosteroid isomerase-like protein